MTDHALLIEDLRAETHDLEALLAGMTTDDWSRPTPSPGWSVQDQVNHLAYFDEASTLAITDADAFRRTADPMVAAKDDFPDRLVRAQRHLTPSTTHRWFRTARETFLATAAAADPRARIPWYGVGMSVRSAVTARIMESWAHGQDIADAVGADRAPTDRLRHICHLGVATRGFSFRLAGVPDPGHPVKVALSGPSGERWEWGEESADQRIEGPALDFCLVVTQRRHLADTALTIHGDTARQWMRVAQAYAGVRGPGRDPRGEPSEPSGS